ncbi:phosphoribosylamine--glycine ligase [Roseococcus sp. DSY-14]|uniref:phosphoribosylamine--glycine ligase n=1 Tax=Roseococcus sp. DSY-14 TaxID=3369650 RepID=UPI00387B7256
MKTPIALALAALLAACAARPATDVLGERLTPEQAECRAEARRSPEVRMVMREANPTPNSMNEARIREERRIAETTAWRRCLRERGLALPGGVEIIRGL